MSDLGGDKACCPVSFPKLWQSFLVLSKFTGFFYFVPNNLSRIADFHFPTSSNEQLKR